MRQRMQAGIPARGSSGSERGRRLSWVVGQVSLCPCAWAAGCIFSSANCGSRCRSRPSQLPSSRWPGRPVGDRPGRAGRGGAGQLHPVFSVAAERVAAERVAAEKAAVEKPAPAGAGLIRKAHVRNGRLVRGVPVVRGSDRYPLGGLDVALRRDGARGNGSAAWDARRTRAGCGDMPADPPVAGHGTGRYLGSQWRTPRLQAGPGASPIRHRVPVVS